MQNKDHWCSESGHWMLEQHEYNSERRDVNAFQGRGTHTRRHRDRTMNTVQVWVKRAHQRRGESAEQGTRLFSWDKESRVAYLSRGVLYGRKTWILFLDSHNYQEKLVHIANKRETVHIANKNLKLLLCNHWKYSNPWNYIEKIQ